MEWAAVLAAEAPQVHPIVANIVALLVALGGLSAVLVAIIARGRASTPPVAPAAPQGQPGEAKDWVAVLVANLEAQIARLLAEKEELEQRLDEKAVRLRRLEAENRRLREGRE